MLYLFGFYVVIKSFREKEHLGKLVLNNHLMIIFCANNFFAYILCIISAFCKKLKISTGLIDNITECKYDCCDPNKSPLLF